MNRILGAVRPIGMDRAASCSAQLLRQPCCGAMVSMAMGLLGLSAFGAASPSSSPSIAFTSMRLYWMMALSLVARCSAELAELSRPYLETCIEAFTPQRCMFESNFPVDKVSFSYNVCWNTFKRLTSGASAEEKAALFHDTAARFYGLDRRSI